MNEVVFVIIRNIKWIVCFLLMRKNRGGNYIFEGWGGDGLGNVFEEEIFFIIK